MSFKVREGCLSGVGERCWGMDKGRYIGPCYDCKKEKSIMEPWEDNYSYSTSDSMFKASELPSEGQTPVEFEYRSNW